MHTSTPSARPGLRVLRVAASVTALSAALVLGGCGDGGDRGRDAKSVTPTATGQIVTHSQSDYDNIIIGWGYKNSPTEITTPAPEAVSARCHGNGESLSVDITAPHGWEVSATYPSEVLTVRNTEQNLSGDLDTANKYHPDLKEIDWSTPDQVDIAAAPRVPDDWYSPYGANQQMYVSLHVDCS